MSELLIAEIGSTGQVAWVWHWRRGMRAARPLKRRSEVRDDLEKCEIFGADRKEILDWIAKQPE